MTADELDAAIAVAKEGCGLAYAVAHERGGEVVVTLEGEFTADALERIAAVLRRAAPPPSGG